MTEPTSATQPTDATFEDLLERARALTTTGQRRILGIVGAPGAGKSHLTQQLLAALGPDLAAPAPMDGFHLAGSILTALGRAERKGAPDTFDGEGYVALLRRLRAQRSTPPSGSTPPRDGEDPASDDENPAGDDKDPARDGVIFAPEYRRDLKESVGSAIPVHAYVPLVITEGNYLLLDEYPWREVRDLLDESWYLEPPQDLRVERLIARHHSFGKTPEAAAQWALGPDERNAQRIAQTAKHADTRWRVVEANPRFV